MQHYNNPPVRTEDTREQTLQNTNSNRDWYSATVTQKVEVHKNNWLTSIIADRTKEVTISKTPYGAER